MDKETKKSRVELLDFIRGIVIISMIIYHTMWDIVYIFDVDISWFKSDISHYWQQSICWTFILLSGFCWRLSHSALKRGIIVFAGGIIVSVVTAVFQPDARVLFGVLTLLGSCMIIMVPLDKLLRKIPPALCLVIFSALFLLTRPVNDGYLGILELPLLNIPEFLYKNLFTAYLGFPPLDFSSSDYFSLVPWLFLFICGYSLNLLFFEKLKDFEISHFNNKYINWIGRKSLIIYMIHQPVIYGILYIIFN